MSSSPNPLQLAGSLATLQQIIDLIEALRELSDPATRVDGLKKVVAILLQLGSAAGIDQAWLDRINQLLSDPELLALVTAIVQYITALAGKVQSASLEIGGAA